VANTSRALTARERLGNRTAWLSSIVAFTFVNVLHLLRPVTCADCIFPYGVPFTWATLGGFAHEVGFNWAGVGLNLIAVASAGLVSSWAASAIPHTVRLRLSRLAFGNRLGWLAALGAVLVVNVVQSLRRPPPLDGYGWPFPWFERGWYGDELDWAGVGLNLIVTAFLASGLSWVFPNDRGRAD
jgi:hypothetical protein